MHFDSGAAVPPGVDSVGDGAASGSASRAFVCALVR